MKLSPQILAGLENSNFVKQLTGGVLAIDNSEYSTWDSCFTQGLFNGGLRRVNARSRAPLAFGGAVHAGLDTFFKLYGTIEENELVEKVYASALADAAVTGLDGLGDPKRNTTRLIDLLSSYMLEYSRVKSMRFDILTLDGKPCVEQSFSVPLGNVDIITSTWGELAIELLWTGKMDLLTNYDNAICTVDHKTTSIMGEKFVDDKMRGNQFLGYTYATRYLAREIFGNRPVFGARVNALASRSSGFEFKLFDLPYPDWKIAEWQDETIASLRKLVLELDHTLVTGQSAPTREHCVTKYGKCQYFDVCDLPPSMKDRMLFDDSYFFVSNWSPLGE